MTILHEFLHATKFALPKDLSLMYVYSIKQDNYINSHQSIQAL